MSTPPFTRQPAAMDGVEAQGANLGRFSGERTYRTIKTRFVGFEGPLLRNLPRLRRTGPGRGRNLPTHEEKNLIDCGAFASTVPTERFVSWRSGKGSGAEPALSRAGRDWATEPNHGDNLSGMVSKRHGGNSDEGSDRHCSRSKRLLPDPECFRTMRRVCGERRMLFMCRLHSKGFRCSAHCENCRPAAIAPEREEKVPGNG